MIELFTSALITILPDYLFRRYAQGKRLGHEITIFNVWYELRWGITACAVLAILIITVIFFFHPTTSNVVSLYRTVSVLSDRTGRVAEVYVSNNEKVAAGDPIFRLDTTREEAAAESARRRIAEIDAEIRLAGSELAEAHANLIGKEAFLRQAKDDLKRREEIAFRNNTVVSEQELDRLRTSVEVAESAKSAAQANLSGVQERINAVLPARKSSAEAALAEAEAEIEESTVYAGVEGTLTQFTLQAGDIVNPLLRPAGILVPTELGRGRFQVGFEQISSKVLHVGMFAEVTCSSEPLTVFPMRIVALQDAISSGQFRPSDRLIDIQERSKPGTIFAILDPVYEGHTKTVKPGSVCAGVAYSNHDAQIKAGKYGTVGGFLMRLADGLGITNAIIIRAQAILIPIRALVF